ncbi:MAG: tetratricopeptide repeat protein [Planctomycetes bacterium]|nr:tetratricopeptide repeat protein [Planctomycetota bacterium]
MLVSSRLRAPLRTLLAAAALVWAGATGCGGAPEARAADPGAAAGAPESTSGESLARESLAEGRDLSGTLAFADRLALQGRFEEALAVLDRLGQQEPGAEEVAVLRARVLLDLGEPGPAARALDALVRQPSASARVLRLAAVAERRAGRPREAQALVRRILADPGLHPDLRNEVQRIDEDLRSEVRTGRRVSVDSRELLARVRGAALPADRVEALRTLAEREAAELQEALELALDDGTPVVRLTGLRLWQEHSEDKVAALRAGLEDPDATVRTGAAGLARHASAAAAVPLLLAALEREQDPAAFHAGHEALVGALGPKVELPFGAERDAAQRARALAAWRRIWQR